MDTPTAKAKPKIIAENQDVVTFKGLNRLPSIDKGELRSMRNLCSDNPTCLSPRSPRQVYRNLTNGTAFFVTSAGKECYVDGTGFYFDGVMKGTVTSGVKSICEFASYVLIFPDKKYYNYSNNTFGTIGNGSVYPASGSCPNIKYACVFNNRVWGIGGQELYASKFKDPFTWTQFSVPLSETDSVYFGIDNAFGELTGIIPLENHIVFTTKNSSIFEVYGNKPSNFTPRLVSNSSGCISHKSLAEIDGKVFLLNNDGISVYGGSYPQPISIQLQEKNCISGVGIAFNRKYYISLFNGSTYSLYVFDTLLNQWYLEDDLNVLDFAIINNTLYALASDNKIYKFGAGTEIVSWEAETDRFTERYLGMKATSKIKIEAELEYGSKVSVYIRNDDSNYRPLSSFTQTGYGYFAAYELPRDAFWFQLKLTGIGPCKIYSINREIIVRSDIE
jgi:hypothetical protein